MRCVGVIGGQEVASQLGSSPRQMAGETQSACGVTLQLSSSAQQAPCGGCTQGFGSHVSHSKRQSSGSGQVESGDTVQKPVAAQHAPDDGGHGFGTQIATSAIQTPSLAGQPPA
jgi:hypothetical protein